MKVIEVGVFDKFANQIDAYLRFTVRKTAVFTVIAQACRAQETLAKFGLILVGMVKFLNSRVAVDTSFALRTLLLLGDEGAKF